MRRSVQRLVICILTFVLCTLFVVPSAQAQVNPYLQPNTNPDVPQDLGVYTQTVMLSVMAGLSCQLSGIDPLHMDPTTGGPSRKCLGYDGITGKIGFVEGGNGAVGVLAHFIGTMYTPPTSTSEYIAYMGNKFGIVEPAYAQGVGFKGISPIVKIWEGFRNLTYLAFVIVFVGIGFMIMLRVKIDPRTVMTIQNSIPKVIIGLVLVTFSFAISGFLIDMMYLSTSLVTNLLAEMTDAQTKSEIYQVPQSNNPFEAANTIGGAGIDKSTITPGANLPIFGPVSTPFSIPTFMAPTGGFLTFSTGPAGSIAEVVGPLAETFPGRLIVGGLLGAAGKIWGEPLVNGFLEHTAIGPIKDVSNIAKIITKIPVIGGKLDTTVKGIVGDIAMSIAFGVGFVGAAGIAKALAFFIVFLFLTIAVIWSLARVWIQLLQAYIWILIDIVTAPLWIIGGMFPGSPVSFSEWLRDMGAQLSAFPATIAMLILAKVFMSAFKDKTELFVPPLVGPQDANIIAPFIGIGFIFIMPVVNQMVKDAFKAPKFPYGAAVGQAIGVSTGLGGTLASTAYSPYGFLAQLQHGPLGRFFGGAKPDQRAKTTVAGRHDQESQAG